MSQQSLIVQFNNIEQSIHILDIHHDVILKRIKCPDPLCFPIVDTAVRDGRITFEYLLSDAISHVNDIETDITLKDIAIGAGIEGAVDASVNNFEVGDPTIYNGTEFIIAYFNFDIEPITARIVSDEEEHVVPVMELTRPDAPDNSHSNMTMSPPADNEANTRDHNVGDSDYATHKIQPWDIWETYLLDPFRADIIKRVLRAKSSNSPVLDMQKIKHICDKIIELYETTDYYENFPKNSKRKK